MIIVCELVCWGDEHVPVNSGLLETIRLAFPHRNVTFCGEESHLNLVRMQIGPEMSSSILWKAISLPPRHAQFSRRWIADFKLLKYLLKRSNEDAFAHLVLTAAGPSILVALKLLLCFLQGIKSTQIILHGNLNELTEWRSRNPFIRWQNLRTALTLGNNKKIQYIVLEESIRETLLRILPSLQGSVAVLDHPIPPHEEATDIINFHPPFHFGFLGLATEAKGFPLYSKVACVMSKKFSQFVEFHVIGRILDNGQKLEMDGLSSKPDTGRLSRNEFVRRLKSLHFTCFPYIKNYYELSPSGTLLDAIAWEKPIIASRLPIFEKLFSRFGDIGYLYENEAEFSQIIEKIIKEADVARYRKQVMSIREVKCSRTTKSLACTYRGLYEKVNMR